MLCGLAACAALTGCSLSEHLARVSEKMEKQYEEVKLWEELPQRTISWEQALAMLRNGNLELRNAQRAIEKAERETLGVYTDLIPSVTYYSYANKAVADLTRRWSGDDVMQNLNVNFSIPTLTQVPYRVYAAQAHAFAAVKAKEGREREQTAKLYQLVRKHELTAALAAHDASAQETPLSPEQLMQSREEQHQYYAEVAKLLGDYTARWNILPETMPHLRWQDYRHRLDKLDALVVCEYALKLEQARMAQYSVALQYLPSINTNLFSPSLFSSTGGSYAGTFLDSHDTKLNLSLYYTLDTRLHIREQHLNYKDLYERTKAEIAVALIDHKDKMAALRRSMDEYEAWRGFMAKRAQFLRTAPTETAADFLNNRKEEADMKRELLSQELQAVESEAALVLEYGMPQ